MLILVQFCASYLIVEFVLQPLWARRVKGSPGRSFLVLAATHFMAGVALVNVGLDRRVTIAAIALAIVHGAIDYLDSNLRKTGWIAFLVGQGMHLACVVAAAAILSAPNIVAVQQVGGAILTSPQAYVIVAIYVGVVFGGGAMVQRVAETFLSMIDEKLLAAKPGLPKAGTYIGWVERFLVLSFVLAGNNEAVGFLLAVKALVRFPEIQEDKKGIFGEYFLVGTFTSMSIALVGGVLLKELIALV